MSENLKLEVGQEVEAMCTKCKGPSIHVIEAIKNDKIFQVICKGCNSSHRYRPATEANINKMKEAIKNKPPAKTKEERRWNRLLNKVDSENPVDYQMDKSFDEKAVINHSKFGMGVVVEIMDQTKISVAFKEGTKTLVQNR